MLNQALFFLLSAMWMDSFQILVPFSAVELSVASQTPKRTQSWDILLQSNPESNFRTVCTLQHQGNDMYCRSRMLMLHSGHRGCSVNAICRQGKMFVNYFLWITSRGYVPFCSWFYWLYTLGVYTHSRPAVLNSCSHSWDWNKSQNVIMQN